MLRIFQALSSRFSSKAFRGCKQSNKSPRRLGLELLENRDLFAGIDFSAPQFLHNGGYGTPAKLAVADLNQDGYLDVVATGGYTVGAATGGVQSAVNVYLNDGRGQLSIRNNYDLPNGMPHSPTLRDITGDGQLDLLLGDGNRSATLILQGRGDGSFDPNNRAVSTDRNRTLAVADFNGDGHADEAIVSSFHDWNSDTLKPTVRVLFGDGRGNFTAGPRSIVAGSATDIAAQIAAGDVNADGLADLVLANDVDGTLSELLGNGDGTFRLTNTLTMNQPRGTKLVDLDQDGDLDLASLGNRDNIVRLWRNDGRGNFAETANLATGSAPVALAVGDINGDGRPDLTVLNQSSSNVSTWEGQGQGVFGSRRDFSVGQSNAEVKLLPTDLALADLNKDGTLDLIVGNGRRNYFASEESRHLAVLMGKPPVASQPGVVQLHATALSVREDAGRVAIRVTRTGGSDGTVGVDLIAYYRGGVAGWATGGKDFSGPRQTITFLPGQTSKTVYVAILDDKLVEGTEKFGIGLMNAKGGVQIGSQAWGEVHIQDDELAGTLNLSVATQVVRENAGRVAIKVLRTEGSDVKVTVDLIAYYRGGVAGWATGGEDFNGPRQTIIFYPGQTSKTVYISILDDKLVEGNEKFGVGLLNPTGGAKIGNQAWGEVTILDNELPGKLGFSASSYRFAAGATELTITVKRTGGSDGTVEVSIPKITMSGNTANAWAVAGVDYAGTGIKLTFAPGETTKSFTLKLLNPAAAGKKIPLMLWNPTGGAQLDSRKTAVVYI